MTIIVLGIPRSGTSLVAGLLHKMGVHMGDELRRPSENNPQGFFEDIPLMRLNDKIMHEQNASNWLPFDYSGYPLIDLNETIKDEIAKRNEKDLWGMKIGTNLTYDAWHGLLTNPKYIIVHRSPLDVLKSMKSATCYPEFHLRRLISFYTEKLMEVGDNHHYDTLEVGYESIIENKEAEIKKIADFVGVEIDNMKELKEFIK